MNQIYCFHLGRERLLSLAELEACFGVKVEHHGEVGLVEWNEFKEPQKFLNQLGGCQKLSQVLEAFDAQAGIEEIGAKISEWIETQKPEGKIAFGLNIPPQDDQKMKKILKKIKDNIKLKGRNGRFLNQSGNLSTVTIVKGGLMKNQTDFNLIKVGSHHLLTRTVAIQDFEHYRLRDYEKPKRLTRAGMLPPKLAQLMINLSKFVAGPDFDFKGKVLYDPFCGSGTVLGEALMKGMQVIGSDVSPEAIEASEENLKWFEAQGMIESLTKRCHLFEKDISQIRTQDLKGEQPDLVVTETFLGPPLRGAVSQQEIIAIQNKLAPFYKKALQKLAEQLLPGTPLVIAFPEHYSKNRTYAPFHEFIPRSLDLQERVHYHRKDQVVGREIVIMKKV